LGGNKSARRSSGSPDPPTLFYKDLAALPCKPFAHSIQRFRSGFRMHGIRLAAGRTCNARPPSRRPRRSDPHAKNLNSPHSLIHKGSKLGTVPSFSRQNRLGASPPSPLLILEFWVQNSRLRDSIRWFCGRKAWECGIQFDPPMNADEDAENSEFGIRQFH
jgi:hypothetical protein